MLPASNSTTSAPMNQSGIYQIRCIATGKIYVGSAVHFRRRWNVHLTHLRGGCHHSQKLQRAWDKYGADQFAMEILEVVEDKEGLIKAEQDWLDRLRPFDRDVGYNISPTAGSLMGTTRSPEQRARASAAQKGKPKNLTPDGRKRISEASKKRKHTPEARAKMSAASKGNRNRAGHSPSQQTREKIGAAHVGNKYNVGRKQSPEVIEKRIAPLRGRKQSPQTIAKRVEKLKGNQHWKGKKHSPETLAKLSAARKGRPLTPEHRAALALGQQRRRERERAARESASSGRQLTLEFPE